MRPISYAPLLILLKAHRTELTSNGSLGDVLILVHLSQPTLRSSFHNPSLLIGSLPLSPRPSLTLPLLTTLPQPSHLPPSISLCRSSWDVSHRRWVCFDGFAFCQRGVNFGFPSRPSLARLPHLCIKYQALVEGVAG
ncbi:unnamed protein product [Pleuronectes platessa]|uniref:Uncharacterized protein n=1 Tax=Pleuronectes platessa TaxID=8262 RepID=A0A9N7Z9N8_PLEPL|nr:unnamed protein product [Pleuronectes platessa]